MAKQRLQNQVATKPQNINKCMFKHTFMVTKTLTITKEAYDQLKALKRPDESFSQTIKRITGNKQDIMRFAGILSDLSDKDIEEMKQSIRELRKRSVNRLRER